MFVTPNPNFRESLLFLKAARDAISCITKESSLSESDKAEVVYFVRKEATDYQVMHLLLEGELPEKKYDLGHEVVLFGQLKEQILINSNNLQEALGDEILNTVLNEVDTIHPFQSSPVLMEHLMMIQEVDPYPETGAGVDIKAGVAKLKTLFAKYAPKLDPAKAWAKATEEFGKIGKWVGSPQAAVKAAAKKEIMKGGKWSRVGRDVKMAAPAAAKKVAPLTGRAIAQAKKATAPAGRYAPRGKFVAPARPISKTPVKADWMKVAKGKVASAKQAAISFAKTPAGQAVGGAAAAALILYGSYKLYKNFISKAGKACAGTGKAKAVCMKKYRHKAISAQITDLRSAVSACKNSKNPAKCSAGVQRKIGSLQAKQSKIKVV